ncbi:MAG: hypothetical protein CM15mP58_08500 [Burkholderiaceae bacterium]|nr:MAG: hypothetical protein CM15mP58_08500 [Burkholderiaceae bacterium]
MMFVANVSENEFTDNKHLSDLKSFASKINTPVVTICASLESQLVDFDENEKKEFLKESGMEEPGLNRLIREAFRLLGLQTFFTAGPNEVRAWTIKKESGARGSWRKFTQILNEDLFVLMLLVILTL